MLLSRALCLQFHDMFSFHLLLYQFNVVIKGGCEITIHVIWTTLDVCFNFDGVSSGCSQLLQHHFAQGHLLGVLNDKRYQLVPFVHSFYAL